MQPSLPNAFDDLKTLSQVSFVLDGELIIMTRENQSKKPMNISVGGHFEPLNLTPTPVRELREEENNWYKILVTGKP